MIKHIAYFTLCSLFISCTPPKTENTAPKFSATTQLEALTQKAIMNLALIPPDSLNIPRSINPDGSLNTVKSRDWTSGFYAGTLWQLYRFSKDKRLKDMAMVWTAYQTKEQFDDHTHDLGFKIYCSFGEGYKLTKDEAYKKVIISAANQLTQRFNEKVGAIKSWDFNAEEWKYPVIIDNMMNLEMLFEAAKLADDDRLYKIADQHAQTTLNSHFRPDNSSVHVVDFDPPTGDIRSRITHQGYSDDSAWARGQAWGLYGFTLAYRATKNPAYLAQAQKIAHFFFMHPNLPEDKIPYWDFNAPNIPNEERDASAAAIAASALLELCQYDKENSAKYISWADEVLTSLSSTNYTATTPPFFLNQSVGSKPGNSEINTPITYADYYYVEGLLRRKEL